MIKSILCVLTLSSTIAGAAETYRMDPSLSSEISLTVPYTLGNHRGKVSWPDWSLTVDPVRSRVSDFKIVFPIESINMGKEKMNCHLREALGLDYTVSTFPKKHVCDRDHRLPKEGPESVAYPEIMFRADPFNLPTSDGAFTVHGTWKIHGVEKSAELVLEFKRTSDRAFELKGSHSFKLEDYGVIVKPFLAISVKGTVEADFRLGLHRSS